MAAGRVASFFADAESIEEPLERAVEWSEAHETLFFGDAVALRDLPAEDLLGVPIGTNVAPHEARFALPAQLVGLAVRFAFVVAGAHRARWAIVLLGTIANGDTLVATDAPAVRVSW